MPKKDYILTTHAKNRMQRRGISEEELQEVLRSPSYSYSGLEGEKSLVKVFKGGKKIRIVYKIEGKKKIILTTIIIE